MSEFQILQTTVTNCSNSDGVAYLIFANEYLRKNPSTYKLLHFLMYSSTSSKKIGIRV